VHPDLCPAAVADRPRAPQGDLRDTPTASIIAREDLRIRGPGEFIGARQSGVPLLRYADLEFD
jgi:hypothetical protein